ncbi:MAG: PEGA domain-containing protein [Bacteroidota bacterium]
MTLSPALEEIRGRLSVRTQPAGASVRIGDRYIGETPLQMDMLVGSYELHIEKQEYSSTEVPVTHP